MISSSFKHPNVLAVVVNWNAGEQLKNCLLSLQNQCPALVVDNASTDNSYMMAEQLTGVTLIKASHNLGFAKACNLGAKNSQVEYLLFLNPDAVVFDEALERTLAFMRSPQGTNVGICGVQLLDETGKVARSCSRFPTPLRILAHSAGLDRLVPSVGYSMVDWSHNSTQQVDQVIGAFFLIRKELFEKLGGFDERFFLYYEEVDLSFRAKQAGWLSFYLADARAFHKGGGTTNQVKALRLFYILRSRLLYSSKHFSFLGVGLVWLSTLLIEPFTRSALALIKRSPNDFSETWQAYLMLSRWIVSRCLTKIIR